MRFRLTVVGLVLWLGLTASAHAACPEGYDCVRMNVKPWCFFTSTDCHGTPSGSRCPEYSGDGHDGYHTKLQQLNWFAANYLACNSWEDAYPLEPRAEEIFIGDVGGLPITRSHDWTIRRIDSQGNVSDAWVIAGGSREMYCPAGFDGPDNEGRCKRKRVPCCDANRQTEHPVLPGTQEKKLRATDLAGTNGLQLERHYNSQSAFPSGVSDLLDGVSDPLPFGPKWVTRWNVRLIIEGDRLRALRAAGNQYVFAFDGVAWRPRLGEAAVLQPLTPANGGEPAWRLIERDDSIEEYAQDGRLLSVAYRDGRHYAIAYDVDYRIQSVVDRQGRSLIFVWDMVGEHPRIVRAELSDGSFASYGYDTDFGRLDTVVGPDGVGTKYLYAEAAHSGFSGSDRHFLVTGIESPIGVRHSTYRYDTLGRVVESGLVDGAGKHTFTIGSSYVDITSPNGIERRSYSLVADAYRVTQTTLRACPGCAVEATATTSYDANGFRDLVTDYRGVQMDLDYDARGLEIQRIEAKMHGGNGNLPEKRTVQTDWHPAYRAPIERRVLDAAGALLQRTTWAYNARGQRSAECRIDPDDPGAMAYVCDSQAQPPARVRQSRTRYCEQAEVDAEGSTCPLLGLVKSVDGPRTDVADITTYTYYPDDDESGCGLPNGPCHRRGDLWRVTNALGHVTEYVAYDRAGQPARIRDPNGTFTDLYHDERGRLVQRAVRASPDGTASNDDAITRIDYDDAGQVLRTTQPDASYLAYTYDAAHRLVAVNDNLGNRIVYTLDAAGNRTREDTRDPSGALTRTLSRVYDQLGRLDQQLDAQGRAADFDYDAGGKLVDTWDALGVRMHQEHDPIGRLRQTIQDHTGLDVTTQFGYDAADRLRTVTDPKGLTTTYTYDGLGDLVQLDSPDTGVSSWTYDAAGNRTSQTDARGVTATYTYDALNRLTGIHYPGGAEDAQFRYDEPETSACDGLRYPIGRLTSMGTAQTQTLYCHDRRGNVRHKQQTVHGTVRIVAYEYSLADRLVSITTPNLMQLSLARDAVGRVTAVRADSLAPCAGFKCTPRFPLVSNLVHLPFGPMSAVTYADGGIATRQYDQNYRAEQIGGPGLALDFSLDAVGNITAVASTDPLESARSYGYDPLYRLESAEQTDGTLVEAFSYDGTGNRLSKATAAGTEAYTYPGDSHRLGAVAGVARQYDGAGNTTRIGHRNRDPGFVYNEANRLVAFENNGKPVASYSHNGRGERVYKEVISGKTTTGTQFVFDESGRLLGEYESGSFGRYLEYVYADELLAAIIESDANGLRAYYVETDHLGTPRSLRGPVAPETGGGGEVELMGASAAGSTSLAPRVWYWPLAPTAFGEHAPDEDPDGDGIAVAMNLRYPGQYFDAESGLHYNYYREYDPKVGRYAQSDPLGILDGPSTYAYVRSKPTLFADPFGLATYIGFGDKQGAMEAANEEAKRVVASCTACTDCGPNGELNDFCIPEHKLQEIYLKLETATYKLKPQAVPNECGWHRGSNVVEIYPYGLGGGCCSLAALLAHEAAHAAGLDNGDRRPRYIEEKCFGCTGRFSH